MKTGSTVCGRFGAPITYLVTRHDAERDTVTVRRTDERGRPYGRRMELPAFAVADPDTEQRYIIARCNEQTDAEGNVTQRWWHTHFRAYGLPAVRVVADLHVPESDRWNWYYQPVTHEGEEAGELFELANLYDRVPEEA